MPAKFPLPAFLDILIVRKTAPSTSARRIVKHDSAQAGISSSINKRVICLRWDKLGEMENSI
jgi:hypothetical protein